MFLIWHLPTGFFYIGIEGIEAKGHRAQARAFWTWTIGKNYMKAWCMGYPLVKNILVEKS